MYPGSGWREEGATVAPKKILSLALMVFLWFFLSMVKIWGSWGEGHSLTPQHLSIRTLLLEITDPHWNHQSPGLRERKSSLSKSHFAFVADLRQGTKSPNPKAGLCSPLSVAQPRPQLVTGIFFLGSSEMGQC